MVGNPSNWLNARGPGILEWMFDVLPVIVMGAVAAAALAYWLTGVVRR